LSLFGLFFLLVGIFKNFGVLPFSLPLAYGLWMISEGYGARIENNPPYIGLLTVWGKRFPVVLREGIWFLANFFPFYLWYIPVLVTRDNYEISLDAYCKAEVMKGDDPAQAKTTDIGAKVDVKVAITFAPDHRAKEDDGTPIGGERIIQFLNSGQHTGVVNILTDVVKEELRDLALNFTWEQFAELKTVLSARLICLVADVNLRKLPRNSSGKMFSPQELKARIGEYFERYDDLEPIEDVLNVYTRASEAEQKKLDEDIFFFLNDIVTSGVADVRDLGINITKFNVTHVFPTGAVADAAAAAAAEKQERTRETRDTETDIELAEKYLDAATKAGKPMDLESALRIVRVNRGRAKETIITGSSGNPILDAAALVKS
jgi:hypothetical protein